MENDGCGVSPTIDLVDLKTSSFIHVNGLIARQPTLQKPIRDIVRTNTGCLSCISRDQYKQLDSTLRRAKY